MQVATIGVDLAKNVFQVHGIAEDESVVFNKPLRRAQVLPFFRKPGSCLIGMESCSSAHRWAREFTALGHDVRLIPPMYVKPDVKRGKSDAIDAEAICEAVGDPSCFRNGRQFAAWLGLVPKQRSSGRKARLFGISKRGDRYLRTTLIHGARAVLGRSANKTDTPSQ